ncbi:YcaO-like family protein [Pseudoalteromonas luteoviolacea]|uniref:YcaO-like family protein n=1 Tax=Pseudoalteromonas luteoviolacea TaxID=43657 RepID=UPI001B3A63B3|nr:YcaO-like family protein [Pseudoalteromonas luteoviolacea]MBQ4876479.1 YcaO-like family protein [Pseudoalteromonas luteoviolacea]MBQ4905110.1 YcaO-like family protein [Pseudoalteromonas luteoviolacea]
MRDTILRWQQNYHVTKLPNNNLIVLNADGEFLFEEKSFPLLHLIDGHKTCREIVQLAKCDEQANRFLSICEYFLSNQLYITDCTGDKILEKPRTLNKLSENIYSDLDIPADGIGLPSSNIQLVISDTLIAANFYAKNLRHLNPDHPVCLIATTDTKLMISPVLSTFSELKIFDNTLKSNKPVLKLLEAYTDSCVAMSTDIQLSTSLKDNHINRIKEILLPHLTGQEQQKVLIEHTYKEDITNKHSYQPITATDIIEQVYLQSRPVAFDNDGGSRCISAEQTVERLRPFISPIVGQITHIEALPSANQSSISIFKTAFFKSLPVKDINNVNNNSFVQVSLGKGVSQAQSMASALCESIERKNAQFRNIIPSLLAHKSSLPHRSYSFHQLTPYSNHQYAKFADSADTESKRAQAVIKFDDEQINWQQTWSLSQNEPVYLPYVLCFANTPYEEDKYGKWHSNGCAAGNNIEEAIMQGLFELIERDAVAIWWYNQLPRPSFDLSSLDTNYLEPLHQTISANHEYWVLDLTIDTGVSVMAAIGKNKSTSGWVFGFGCHLKPELAAQRALTELCQLIPIRDQNGAPFDFDAIEKEDFLIPNSNSSALCPKLEPSGDLKLDILAVVEQLKGLGMETLVLDYSQEPIPIKTAKVFVPGLCHIWPQLGNQRLYSTPVKLGLRDEPLNENTINQQGLYI